MVSIGDRIKLTKTTNEYSEVKIGDIGMVILVDGTRILVKWEAAGMVPIIKGEDDYEVLTPHETITFKVSFNPQNPRYDNVFFGNGLANLLEEWRGLLKGGFTFEIERPDAE